MDIEPKSPLYRERLTSPRTLTLFLGLTLLFGLLFAWRVSMTGFDTLGVIWLCCAILFLFYTVNYRTLVITITSQSLKLKFGIFRWTERLDNMASCQLDELPWLLKYGGAGIHFMTVNQRYRASFNFLEYPRVVIALKRKRGLVSDLSFSTRQPEQVIQSLHGGSSG
jgi:Ca2+/Na+ antiporter